MAGQRMATFIAQSPAHANAFIQNVNTYHRGNITGLVSSMLTGNFHRAFEGIHVSSQTRRELLIHERESSVQQMTREYLDRRHPLSSFVTHQPARLSWHHLPVTHESRADSFLNFLRSIGAPRSLAAADWMQARDGASMLYIDAPGSPASPLEPGLTWRRLVPIKHSRIHDNDESYILDETNDPILSQHGFEFIDIDLAPNRRETVHGSRLVALNDDPAAEGEWWWTPPVLDTLHDTLWDHLDVMWSRKRLHFEGDPIIVRVPVENERIADYWTNRLDETKRDSLTDKVRSALRLFQRTGKSANIATVAGFETSRLGHADMPDPTPDHRAIASLVSNAMGGYPVSVILSSTKGSERVDDADVKAEATWVRNRRGLFCEPLLDHMLMLARRSGIAPARTPRPTTYFWPDHHVLSPNDAASVHSITAKATRTMWEMGRQMPLDIRNRYPIDPDVELPPAFALRGRDEDGSSIDPIIPGGGGGAGGHRTSSPSVVVDDVVDEVMRKLEAELEQEARHDPGDN